MLKEKNNGRLNRPKTTHQTTRDGVTSGVIVSVTTEKREDTYKGGTRDVLEVHVNVESDDGEPVTLYSFYNINWSKKSNLMKFLDKLGKIPTLGESIELADLVGLPVQVTVENVEKNGETYSNIVSIRKLEKQTPNHKSQPAIEDDDLSDFE